MPEEAAAVADWLELGDDMWNEMDRVEDVPTWTQNDMGSAFVQNIGHIKMKPPDWRRWFNGCFQTMMWLGTALSSYVVQEKENERRSRKRRKGTSKGKRPMREQRKRQTATAKAKGKRSKNIRCEYRSRIDPPQSRRSTSVAALNNRLLVDCSL